ncbi:GNAT family N-acetyltransferase [Nocardioides sp.]|uniref:GNAT family N-acetyltransferase n=1 Tax=Nocardioides sp. TaxID=35761 RepID=UPI002636CCFD|nr:GNAT family N-acetyltransferase [Nocardioides sp.]
MDIRRALPADLPAVAAIYGREALEGHATFDLEPRPMHLWEEPLTASGPGEHFLVAEDDGAVVGYATSGPYRPKPAYLHTRESTVYVAPDGQGRGTGRALYDVLLPLLAADGVRAVVAGVALPNPASLALHRACGFEEVGTMRQVGRKFDRWIDLTWLQKLLA